MGIIMGIPSIALPEIVGGGGNDDINTPVRDPLQDLFGISAEDPVHERLHFGRLP